MAIKFKSVHPSGGETEGAKPNADRPIGLVEACDYRSTIQPCPDTDWFDPLLVTGDSDEFDRVGLIFAAKADLLRYLQEAVSEEDVADATSHFGLARGSVKIFERSVKNLVGSRRKGTQTFAKIKIAGPTIGLAAKLEKLRCPELGPAELALSEKVSDVKHFLFRAAELLKQRAAKVENLASDPEYCNWQKRSQRPVPTLRDAMRWRDLSGQAADLAAKLDAVLIDLTRSRRQVMIEEEQEIRGRAKPERDAKLRPTRHAT